MTKQIDELMALADEYASSKDSPTYGIENRVALKAALEAALKPGEPEMHQAMCPALTGGKCNCPENPAFVDKAWARFCGVIGRGPDAPYPGMIEAFETHYGQSFTDKDWRNETSVWAAAWKAAVSAPPAQTPPPWWPAVEAILNQYGLQAIDFVADWKKAQTPPPRLTEEEMMGIQEKSAEQLRAYIYGKTLEKPQTAYRLVETAVRKQWAKQFGVNDE